MYIICISYEYYINMYIKYDVMFNVCTSKTKGSNGKTVKAESPT